MAGQHSVRKSCKTLAPVFPASGRVKMAVGELVLQRGVSGPLRCCPCGRTFWLVGRLEARTNSHFKRSHKGGIHSDACYVGKSLAVRNRQTGMRKFTREMGSPAARSARRPAATWDTSNFTTSPLQPRSGETSQLCTSTGLVFRLAGQEREFGAANVEKACIGVPSRDGSLRGKAVRVPHCGKNFSSSAGLKDHQRTHTG